MTDGSQSSGRVLIVDGYGCSLRVHRKHLVIEDGVGPRRRERRLSRVERGTQTIVVMARDGYITLDAYRWCSNVGITIVQIDKQDGTVVSVGGAVDQTTYDARTRRSQVAAGLNGHNHTALTIIRMVLSEKIARQAQIVDTVCLDRGSASMIRGISTRLEKARTAAECRSIEGSAAAIYWQSWVGVVCPSWPDGDLLRIPAHWCMYTQRPAVTHTTNRRATDPVNACLNYGYKIGEVVCRNALLEQDLDPSFGVLHTDKPGRASLALDLLEVVRPDIDATVIDLLGANQRVGNHRCSRKMFHEQGNSVVRVLAPLTYQLVESMPVWSEKVQPYARRMRELFQST